MGEYEKMPRTINGYPVGETLLTFSFEDFSERVIAQLTDDERQGAVVYRAESLVAAGTHLELPGTRIDEDTDSYLGFIDRDPTANWGHEARYVIMDVESGVLRSVNARLPPFRSGVNLIWRLVYRGPSVPETAVERPS